jgi:hypothetical protein
LKRKKDETRRTISIQVKDARHGTYRTQVKQISYVERQQHATCRTQNSKTEHTKHGTF